jgi:hypothetical protein
LSTVEDADCNADCNADEDVDVSTALGLEILWSGWMELAGNIEGPISPSMIASCRLI